MHCLLPGPWNSVCKVQGCSFAQTTWGSEMLTALSLSRYPQTQQIFLTFGDVCVCVGGCIYKCQVLSPVISSFFVRPNVEHPKGKTKKKKDASVYVTFALILGTTKLEQSVLLAVTLY